MKKTLAFPPDNTAVGLGCLGSCGPVVPQFPSGRYGGRRPRAVVRLLGKTDRVWSDGRWRGAHLVTSEFPPWGLGALEGVRLQSILPSFYWRLGWESGFPSSVLRALTG